MHEKASTGVGVDHQIELDEVVGPVSVRLVVHAAVAARDGLELVVEVDDDLMEREDGGDHHVVGVDGLGGAALAALVHHQAHDVADVLRGGDDVRLDDGLLDALDH